MGVMPPGPAAKTAPTLKIINMAARKTKIEISLRMIFVKV
jgi:hypothetical protein